MLTIVGMGIMLVVGVIVGFIIGLLYVGDDCGCKDDERFY